MKLKVDLTKKISVALKDNKALSRYWEIIIEKAYNSENTEIDKLLLEKYIKNFNLFLYFKKRKKLMKYRKITLFLFAIFYFLEAYFLNEIHLNPIIIITLASISILLSVFAILFFTYLSKKLKNNRFNLK